MWFGLKEWGGSVNKWIKIKWFKTLFKKEKTRTVITSITTNKFDYPKKKFFLEMYFNR